jgi:GntR family transcriptional regulator/MocR family aminotransferase
MATLPISLDRGAAGPLYRQIVARLRAAILAGTLPAGSRLPSSRGLASQLGIARGTADAAYAVLAGEGVLLAQGSAGTVVSPHFAAPWVAAKTRGSAVARPEAHSPQRVPALRMGLPALDAFPRKLWSRLAAREIRRTGPDQLAYPDPAGHQRLSRHQPRHHS